MGFYLEKAIFINRAPFTNLELNFKEGGINVLTAINGKGKTTILSYIVDSFFELAKKGNYSNEFEGKENSYYRISSTSSVLEYGKLSIVYFRFRNDEQYLDYVDIINCDEVLYNNILKLDNKIQYSKIKNYIYNNSVKYWDSIDDKIVQKIWSKYIITSFPAYRYEEPSFLTPLNQVKHTFQIKSKISGYLPNPIRVISNLNQLMNWMLDVILDATIYNEREYPIWDKLNLIISSILSGKEYSGVVRLGIGKRNNSGSRIAIMNDVGDSKTIIVPNIMNLSSGELALLSCFGEIIHQADNLRMDMPLEELKGIVIIDEVDKHLHIKLQKEILPKMFNLFPNVQFIVSSHSPFLNMGLADELFERSQIMDLDNGGIICAPNTNNQYNEVYDMMISENDNFKNKYEILKEKITEGTKPIIITEGKTDYRHIKNAQKILGINLDVEYYEVPEHFGDSALKSMLDNLSKIKQLRKVIGIFDRDSNLYLNEYGNDDFKSLNDSNVYAFAIPLVNKDLYGDKISIEHYYKMNDLTKVDCDGRRIFLGNEFYISGNSKDGKYQTKISNIKHKVEVNGVIDDKVYNRTDLKQEKSIALTKVAFIDLIETNETYRENFDFSNFSAILDIIKRICDIPLF